MQDAAELKMSRACYGRHLRNRPLGYLPCSVEQPPWGSQDLKAVDGNDREGSGKTQVIGRNKENDALGPRL